MGILPFPSPSKRGNCQSYFANYMSFSPFLQGYPQGEICRSWFIFLFNIPSLPAFEISRLQTNLLWSIMRKVPHQTYQIINMRL